MDTPDIRKSNGQSAASVGLSKPTKKNRKRKRRPVLSRRRQGRPEDSDGGRKCDPIDPEKLLANLISDDDAAQRIIDAGGAGLFENAAHQAIADTAIAYFHEHGRAPGDDLYDLLKAAHRETLLKIESLALQGDEAEADPEGTEDPGQDEQAHSGQLIEALNAATRTYREFAEAEFPPVDFALEPVLKRPGITQIRGARNHFKTGLLHYMLVGLAAGKDVFGWKCKRSHKVLLFDGELPQASIQQMLKGVCADLGVRWRAVRKNLHVVSKSEVEDILSKSQGERYRLNLADAAQTDILVEYFTQFEVVGLDSIKALVSGIDLDRGLGWDVIDDLCVRCRDRGTSIARAQHMGKDKRAGSRGASDQEDRVDVVIQVCKKTSDEHHGNPTFKVTYPKQGRNQDPRVFIPFEFETATNEGGLMEIRLNDKDKKKKPSSTKRMIPDIKDLMRQKEWGGKDDITQEEFGKTYGAKKWTVSKAAKKAREELIKEGFQFHD